MKRDTDRTDSDRTTICVLLDYYGALLSEPQRNVLKLYFEDDLSLSEISGLLKISRQGVHDLIRRGSDRLVLYERKLGLFERDQAMYETVRHARESLAVSDYEAVGEDLMSLSSVIGLGS